MASYKKKSAMPAHVYRSQSYNDLFDAIGACNSQQVQNILQTTKDPISLMKKKDLQGLTPLRKAIALGQADIAQILVVAGADASQKGALKKEALHEAALVGQRSLIAPLLSSANISVNIQDAFGMTPLHNAIRGKHVKAVEWLLFAGADVNTPNASDESPISLVGPDSEDENQRQIYKLLDEHRDTVNPLELKICCGYVGKKQISNMDSDGSLTFITSDFWPEHPQFVFGVKVTPDLAKPHIPLRQDERFYCYVYKYKLMYLLPENQRRIQICFTTMEEFMYSELVLKVCSKSKYIGELPVTITSYPQHKYINYLATCEVDLQNEGQFVLVKRPLWTALNPDIDGILSFYKVPLFKLAATAATFAKVPPDWNQKRRDREYEEMQQLVAAIPETQPKWKVQEEPGLEEEEDMTNNNSLAAQDRNTNAVEEAAEDEDEAEHDYEVMFYDWSEPDTCEEFYYISRGWTCYIEYRRSMNVETINHKYPVETEDSVVRCMTDFIRLHHPANALSGEECMCQIPKNNQFVKIGTVLVFQRQELAPGEKEDPNPDDKREEHYLSDDGRRTNGKVWLDREMKKWNLIPSGIVNKPTRIIFNVNALCTYVAIQLNIGEEKWELDSDEEDSDDESDDDFDGGEGEEGQREEGEEGGEVKKKKKKKKKRDEEQAEGEENVENEGDENASNAASVKGITSSANKNNNHFEVDPTETIIGGIEPLDEEFALGLDKLADDHELKDGYSSEDLVEIQMKKSLSIQINNVTEEGLVQYPFGPRKREDEFEEEHMNSILTQIALNWRCRNHREAKTLVFTRHKSESCFDMVVELVQQSDLTVRAEARWSDGYNMVASSQPFLTLTGRRYTFYLEGHMIIESPANAVDRTMFFYSINVNELNYVVKRKIPEETNMPGKKMRKKEDPTTQSNEIDAYLILTTFPNGMNSDSDSVEVLKLPIPLTGPNLWRDKHLQLRLPDNDLLDRLITVLKLEPSFHNNWWKVWILFAFEEKLVDVEKVKQDWPGTSEQMLKRWFNENIDAPDRGLTILVYILDSLRLEVAHLKLLGELKYYKRKIQDELNQPRQLDLLFHWSRNTKITSDAFRRKMKEYPVMSPTSDQFLMYLNEVLNPELMFEIGAHMEVEDNVMNSINGEENIIDPRYKIFKVLIKSRQKKEEIIGFTLMLIEMVRSLEQHEAYDYVVKELRRWMSNFIDVYPDTCKKLDNYLENLAKKE